MKALQSGRKTRGFGMKMHWRGAAAALVLTAALPAACVAQSAPPPGFTSLFDGKTLNGWKGDTTVWSVKDGAITGGADQPIKANTFLAYQKPYRDFEVHYKYRWLTPDGNSGFQFRSAYIEGNYAMTGYQANVIPLPTADQPQYAKFQPERYAMLYNEGSDRQEIALLGQRATLTRRSADGGGTARIVRTVSAMVNSRDAILGSIRQNPEWNEGVVIAYGNHIVSAINGMLVFDAIDNDPIRPMEGLFALQAHDGPPMIVQYKDIYVKPLTSMPDIEGRFRSTVTPAPEPTQTYKDSTHAGLKDVALPQ
jgi:hypothetical protein